MLVNELDNIIKKNLIKYTITPKQYSDMKIMEIFNNKKNHFVGLFKEYLIYDDINEFLIKYVFCTSNIKNLTTFFFKKSERALPRKNYLDFSINKIMKKAIRRGQNTCLKNNVYQNEVGTIFSKNYENESSTETVNNNSNDVTYSIDLQINSGYDYKMLKNFDFSEPIEDNKLLKSFQLRKKNISNKSNLLLSTRNTINTSRKSKDDKRNNHQVKCPVKLTLSKNTKPKKNFGLNLNLIKNEFVNKRKQVNSPAPLKNFERSLSKTTPSLNRGTSASKKIIPQAGLNLFTNKITLKNNYMVTPKIKSAKVRKNELFSVSNNYQILNSNLRKNLFNCSPHNSKISNASTSISLTQKKSFNSSLNGIKIKII